MANPVFRLRLVFTRHGRLRRGELYPHSDIDLALITPNELSETQQEQIAQFVQTLWDNQLTPALQSGSLKQFIQAANEDLSVNTALLEARFLAGDATFAEHALNTFRLQRDTVSFIDSKIQEMQTRHAKQPALTLEPNIKNGIGSLRDIHTIIWLAHVQNLTPQIALRKRIITPTEAKLMRQSHQHLAQLRIDLHLAAGREEDRLIFDHQATLAQHSSTEQLMHRFYRTVKTIMQLNSILIPMLKERVYSTYPRIVHNINEHYFQIGNKIAAHDLRLFQTQPEHIFQIINICQSRSDINGIAPKPYAHGGQPRKTSTKVSTKIHTTAPNSSAFFTQDTDLHTPYAFSTFTAYSHAIYPTGTKLSAYCNTTFSTSILWTTTSSWY